MRNRRVFFVSAIVAEDAAIPAETLEFVVASRRQAKRVIHRMRRLSLEVHNPKIQKSRQDEIRGTGWVVRHQGSEGLRL
jgi:hypothetical protein